MKVLIVSPNFYPSVGGVESHLIELIRALPDTQFVVLTNWRNGVERAASLFPNVEFHYSWPSDRFLRRLASSRSTVGVYRVARGMFELLRHYNRHRPLRDVDADVVHFHFLDLDQASRLAHKIGVDHVIRTWCDRLVKLVADRAGVLFTDHTIFTSPPDTVPDSAKDALLATFRNIVSVDAKSFDVVKAYQQAHGGRCWFVPNSVDTQTFQARPRSHQGFRVGFAGRAGKAGADILVEVARRLGSQVRWSLAVAGEPPDVKRAISGRMPPGSELFLNLDYLAMPYFYSSIDLLLNPFPGEGVGRTTLEAMACGVPVVVVGTGEKYPIRNGETGYIVPPSPNHIARTIRTLTRDLERVGQMGRSARSVVASEFASAVVLPRIREIYADVSQESRGEVAGQAHRIFRAQAL